MSMNSFVPMKFPFPAHPPIHRIPNEILSEIFSLLCSSQEDLRNEDEVEKRNELHVSTPCRTRWQVETEAPPWTNVLYVCRHWRAVASNSATLWTRIDNNNPKWAVECIRRSQQMPLHFTIRQTESNLRGVTIIAQLAATYLSRVQDLNIEIHDHQFMDHVFDLLTNRAAPRLEVLSITGCKNCEDDWDIPSDKYERFPYPLFAQHSPNVRKLRLEQYCRLQMHPSSMLFTTLTHLEVRRSDLWGLETMDDFINCVESWTQLQDLALLNAVPEDIFSNVPLYPIPRPSRRITLPSIERIRLTGYASCVDHFLSYLVLPPSVTLVLSCETHHPDFLEGDSLVVMRSLLSHIPAAACSSVDEVSLHTGPRHWVEIYGKTMLPRAPTGSDSMDDDSDDGAEEQLEADPNSTRLTRFCVQLGNYQELTICPGYLDGVFAQLNLCNAVAFDYSIYQPLWKETWIQMLRSLQKLENMQFLCSGIDVPVLNEFVEALGTRDPESGGLLLPRLRLINFDSPHFDEAAWKRLLSVLTMRYEAGERLQFIMVSDNPDDKDKYRVDEHTEEGLNKLFEEPMVHTIADMSNGSRLGETLAENSEDEISESEEEELL